MYILTPTILSIPTKIVKIAPGSSHALFLDINGNVYVTGSNIVIFN